MRDYSKTFLFHDNTQSTERNLYAFFVKCGVNI